MKKLALTALLLVLSINVYAADDLFQISESSINKIHSDEFAQKKKTFAESPSLFKNHSSVHIPKEIAFEDSRVFRLTPGDVIKISEDLTFGDWGGSSAVAEEDFTVGQEKKKVEEHAKPHSKGIKFSM